MYFLHAFPSRAARIRDPSSPIFDYDPDVEIRDGLRILEGILGCGLLLSKEQLRIGNFAAAEKQACKSMVENPEKCTDTYVAEVDQLRACFTLSSCTDLARRHPHGHQTVSHLDIFGRFAVGITLDVGRKIGLLPVNYFYRASKLDHSLASLSATIPARILQIRDVLTLLSLAVSAVEHGQRTGKADFVRRLNEAGLDLSGVPPGQRQKVLDEAMKSDDYRDKALSDLLDFDRYFSDQLADSANLILALYQTVDSRSFQCQYMYYFQNEWRLLPNLNSDAVVLALRDCDTDSTSAKQLIARQAEIRGRLSKHPQDDLDDGLLLWGYREPTRHFADLINIIVCPPEARRDVIKLLGKRASQVEVHAF